MKHFLHRWDTVCIDGHAVRRCRVCNATRALPRPVNSRGSQPLCEANPLPPPPASLIGTRTKDGRRVVSNADYLAGLRAEAELQKLLKVIERGSKPSNPDEPNPRLIVNMEPWEEP